METIRIREEYSASVKAASILKPAWRIKNVNAINADQNIIIVVIFSPYSTFAVDILRVAFASSVSLI